MRGIERLSAVEISTPQMTRALPLLPMDETVMVRLLRIAVVGLGHYFEPVFRDIGLNESCFHVLCLLVANDSGQASPGELSELVGTSRANMTRILDSLSDDGLITRASSVYDARRSVVQITPKGKVVTNAAVPRLSAPLKRAFDGLSAVEFTTLAELLRKAVVSFDKGLMPLGAAPKDRTIEIMAVD